MFSTYKEGTKMPKYSIITVAVNEIHLTVNCIQSIFKHTQNFELIVVDNMCDDGTTQYLSGLPYDNVKVVRLDDRKTFSEANNCGRLVVDKESEYVIFLNNDTVVSKDWLDRMEKHFTNTPLKNVGAVGPVSCMSNGKQMVGKQNPEQWHRDHYGKWVHVGVLYGWCMMIKKSVIDEVGDFDEIFVNGHEDNDLSLRIQHAGYKLVLAYDTYIDHVGQGTIRTKMNKEQYLEAGKKNRDAYYSKWSDNKTKKLVAVYRSNGGEHLEESLAQTSKFADHILIHFCRISGLKMLSFDGNPMPTGYPISRESYVGYLMKKFPKIRKIEFYDGAFQEDYERNWLLQEALKMQQDGEADWCISIDDDEIYEDKFIDRVQAYMNPANPEIFAYWCNWRTIWDTQNGKELYRTDSTFGSFTNYRFFRLMKGQQIHSYHPEGHHCGSAPYFADENLQWMAIRVKHLGYDSPEQRQRKYDFYQANDHFKSKADIGNEDYSHLIDRDVRLQEWKDNNGISCVMMVKNEQDHIRQCLESVQYLVDEFVVVDTGSSDMTIDIVREFSKTSPVPVRIFNYSWDDVYARPRNYGKSKATQEWILFMDADETFAPEDVHRIFKISEKDVEAAIFQVLNYTEEPRAGVTPKYYHSQACRLFRNRKEYYFTGIVHETIDDSLMVAHTRKRLKTERANFPLHHFGYLSKRVKTKFDYYEKLNNRQIDVTEGKDARPYYNIALHRMEEDDMQEAIRLLHKSAEVDPNFHHAHKELASVSLRAGRTHLERLYNTLVSDHPSKGQIGKMLNFLNENDFGFCKLEEMQEA